MVAARRRDSDQKLTATAAVINAFLLNGTLISISAVAAAASVSRNFIYSHDGLLHQLEAARQTQLHQGKAGQRRPTNGAPGRAALDNELRLACQTIKRLRQELSDLHDRHEQCLGRKLQASQNGDSSKESISASREAEGMVEENRTLRTQVQTLTDRIDDLLDDLTAERRGNDPNLVAVP
jgi:FtsZ-binding cell division protein ZapB